MVSQNGLPGANFSFIFILDYNWSLCLYNTIIYEWLLRIFKISLLLITLDNDRLLKLEGHDLQLGWHAFLWYKKR